MRLQVHNVTKKFKQRTVLDDMSFDLETGRCLALIGPNGAGKSTLLRILAGLLQADKGTVSLHQNKNWKQKVGYLPQVPSFGSFMTAREFLTWMAELSKAADKKKRVDEVLKQTGIEEAADRMISGFSGGMKQRLGLAQAILHRPEFLILDEPVSALDPAGRRDVIRIIQEMKEHTTIIYSTHVLYDAEEISDDVLLMKNGRKVAYGPMTDMLLDKEQRYVLKTETAIPIRIEQCSLVKRVEYMNASSAVIYLLDDACRLPFLQWCLGNRLDVIHFQRKKTTLEEVFMEVMV